MKRTSLICMMIAMLTAIGCDETKEFGDVCGDGILGEHEICDGAQIRPGAVVHCPDGSTADISRAVCTPTCTLDLSNACSGGGAAVPVCGNGIIEAGEDCDNSMPIVTANCDNPDFTRVRCENCRIVDTGVCPVVPDKPVNGLCGNGIIDDGEMCDGSNIPAAVKKCPVNMVPNINPLFKCTENCKLVDVGKACHFQSAAMCGNEKLDQGEACDGGVFDESLVSQIKCGPGKKLDRSKIVCSACSIDTTDACIDLPYEGLMFSEIAPGITPDNKIEGIAVEIANRGDAAIDLDGHYLALFSAEKIEKKYSLKDLGIASIDSKKAKVLCFQTVKDKDVFGGKCDVVIDDGVLLESIGKTTLLGLTRGPDDAFTDLLNFNSFVAAIAKGAVDFIRGCSVQPHTTPSETTMSDPNWFITADKKGAPAYNLGKHCDVEDVSPDKIQCTFKLMQHELTSRNGTVDMALEIKIPGITDKTDKTDPNDSVIMHFAAGSLKNSAVDTLNIHFATPVPDMAWTNADGFDRYTGTLHNWGTYEGFMSYETGDYVYDARISLDNEQTFIYCGREGVVENYAAYDPDKRELLKVSYDDGGTAQCGDGVISSSEVCDGDKFVGNAMICPDPGQVFLYPEMISCGGGCSMTNIENACSTPIKTCGNNRLDDGEACDGANIPDEAKVCDDGYIAKTGAVWTCAETCSYVDKSDACVKACGNGTVDAEVPGMNAEVCDGDNIPEAAKVCPKGMVPKADAVWKCNDTCGGIVVEDACENACGNGRLDKGEDCDGDLYVDNIESVCGKNAIYASERRACTDKCRLDAAACISKNTLVIDEFAVKKDAEGNPKAAAFSINLYGAESMDATMCTLSVLDDKGKALSNANMTAFSMYPFSSIASSRLNSEDKLILEPCRPLVVCSMPMDNPAEYAEYAENIFQNKCEAFVALPASSTKHNGDYLITKRDKIHRMQITCGGEIIETFDYAGLNAAVDGGAVMGKLKAPELPWAGSASVKFADRFTTSETFDMTAFAAPVCVQD